MLAYLLMPIQNLTFPLFVLQCRQLAHVMLPAHECNSPPNQIWTAEESHGCLEARKSYSQCLKFATVLVTYK